MGEWGRMTDIQHWLALFARAADWLSANRALALAAIAIVALFAIAAALGRARSARAKHAQDPIPTFTARPDTAPSRSFSPRNDHDDDDDDDEGAGHRRSAAPTADWRTVIKRLEAKRGSRVIALVHRHRDVREDPRLWYYLEEIGVDHMEDALEALRAIPAGTPLDIVLHAIDGEDLAVQQIARAIKAHKGKTTVFIPYYARYGSTLLALAADEIAMGPAAAISAIVPTSEFMRQLVAQKDIDKVEDETLLWLYRLERAIKETRSFVCELLHGDEHHGTCAVSTALINSDAHSQPIGPAGAKALGLNVTTNVPTEVFDLIRACRTGPLEYGRGVRHLSPARAQEFASNTTAPARAWIREKIAASERLGEQTERRALSTPHTETLPVSNAPAPAPADGVTYENCSIELRPLIAKLQNARGSRVISIVHRLGMESRSFDLPTGEDALVALQNTDPNKPIDIILHTPGGESFAALQVARALKAHKGKKTVFVPYYAMSAGTLISLAADEIVLADHAVLGPVDSQVYWAGFAYPIQSIHNLVATKSANAIDDTLLLLANRYRTLSKEDHDTALEMMAGTYAKPVAEKIARTLTNGELSHSYPLTAGAARKLGLHVSTTMPPEVFALTKLLRRPGLGDASVIYCL